VFPPDGKTFIGVLTKDGAHDFTELDQYTKAAKRQPQVMLFATGWAVDPFDRSSFDKIANRGMLPMLGWEPWDYRATGNALNKGVQPAYKLSRIYGGEFDDYIRSYAEGIKKLNYPVAIRFAHEMNGNWYPWAEEVNGNKKGDYVKAWRHVHDLFQEAGTTNVTWVWSPNVKYSNSTKLAGLYPGDQYVDWVGLSGYYGTANAKDYRSFDKIFDATIQELRTFTQKPLVITETGATESGGRKVEWIEETFRVLPQHSDIIGLIWYESIKELDWRIISSPAAAAAFARGVADRRYDFTWSADMVLRTEVPLPGKIPTPTGSPSETARSSASGSPSARTSSAPAPTRSSAKPTPTTGAPTSPSQEPPPTSPSPSPTP
jgi:hypothetical protein